MASVSRWCISLTAVSSAADSVPAPAVPLSAREAKTLVNDLFPLKPWVYWLDLTSTLVLTYAAIGVYLGAPTMSAVQLAALNVGALGLYRAATFMHEIVHMRRGHMKAFKLFWNVAVGIPLLTPSLFYTSHADHHSNRYYGTPADGEYLPFGATPPLEIIRFLAMIPLVPVLAVLRALFLVPLSMMSRTLRRWLLGHASAAVISSSYRRRNVPSIKDPWWLAADLGCFIYAACLAALCVNGIIVPSTLGMLYLLVVYALSLNWLRTLAAHRYRNSGEEITHSEQVLDSINITGPAVIAELIYPVGLRYHALHHLLPSLPYHAMGSAHRRLMDKLPADSRYRETSCRGTISALRQLWRDARNSGAQGVAIRRAWHRT